MAGAQLQHTRQVDARRVRREWAWPRTTRSTGTGGMHCHRDYGMERKKCSSQCRSEWPQHFHLCAATFRGHIHHKGGRRCSAATDHVYHSVLTLHQMTVAILLATVALCTLAVTREIMR